MAQTIHILPENLANKIAAGEVVQRPASAVKELIENAIDAGAKSITIIVKEGGKTLIQVVDDGDGMSREDAEMAFQRHATSKIATYEDLECIRTLGFRGEALASIAAVSQVELRTRSAHSEVGINVRINGGSEIIVHEDACQRGTSIQVKNLFFNTPGRRNFLKSTNTEYRNVQEVIQRAALSHPELEIRFVSDGEPVLGLRPDSHRSRMGEVFGKKLAESLIYFEERNEQVKISGFLGKPEFARKGRAAQYLFLNKRFILSRNINHAVYQAYEHLLEKGSFPLFVLFLSIDPQKIDVNVHPSKMEVKFEDESSVYRTVLSAVRKALSAYDLIPSMEVKGAGVDRSEIHFQIDPASAKKSTEKLFQPIRSSGDEDNYPYRSGSDATKRPDYSRPRSQIELQGTENYFAGIWQLLNKYIIVPGESGLMIVDQHAAHERVLYESVRKRFTEGEKHSQQLLFPQTLQMDAGDAALVRELLPNLELLGFSLKLFGNTTIILEGVPPEIKPGHEAKILQDILDSYKEDENKIKIEPSEKLAKSFSCKAAIKAGDPLSDNEMKSLLARLFAAEIPYVCPHGRPVTIKLSLSELDRRFGRTS